MTLVARPDARVELKSAPPGSGPPRRKGLAGNISALASGQLVTWVIGVVWTLVVPRALGPSAMGVLVAALAFTSLLSLLVGVGDANYLVRTMVADRFRAARVVGTALFGRALAAPLLLLTVAAYVRIRQYSGNEALVYYLVAVAAAVGLFQDPIGAGFQSLERMGYVAASSVITTATQGLAGIVIVLMGLQVVGVAAASLLMAVLSLGLSIYWARSLALLDFRTDLRQVCRLVVRSLPFWSTALAFTVYLWVDSVILSIIAPPRVVGWYGVATRLFGTFLFIPTVLAIAWFPRLVIAFGEGQDQLRRVARPFIEILLVLGVPACAGSAIAARPLIHLLYGSAYDKAAPVMVILALCLPLTYLGAGFYQVLCALNRPIVMMWILLGASLVNIGLNLALIGVFERHGNNGAVGSALSLFITEVLITSTLFMLVGRQLVDRHSLSRLLRTLAAVATMWITFFLAQRPMGDVVALPVAGLTFATAFVLLRIPTEEERASVIQLWLQHRPAFLSVRARRAPPAGRDAT